MHTRKVPSFGSFRSRPAPQEPPAHVQQDTEGTDGHAKSHRHVYRQSRKPYARNSPPRERSVRAEGFVLDRFGDANNARYGPPRESAQYRRATSAVLGLPEHMRIASSTHTHATIESVTFGRTPAFYARLAAITADAPERIIAGRSEPVYPEFIAIEPADEDAKAPPPPLDGTRQEARLLNAHLAEHPEDVNGWLRLMRLQEHLVPREAHSIAAVARVKVAVLERALEYPPNAASLPLTLERMRLLANYGLRTGAELHAEWRQIIGGSSSHNAADLWLAYLEFCRTDWHTFELDAVLEAHAEAVRDLERSVHADDARTKVCLGAALMLQGAGYMELATALFQALLELNFEQSILPHDAVLDIFEAWWDAGAARIGEPGDYRGFSPSGTPEAQPGGDEPEDGPVTHEDWCTNELLCASDIPRRLSEAGYDPFAYILAQDVRPLLFFVQDRPRGLLCLLDGFLRLLGMPFGSVQATVALLRGEPVDSLAFAPNVVPKVGMSSIPHDWCAHHNLSVHLYPPTFDTLYTRSDSDPRGYWFSLLSNIPDASLLRGERTLSHFIGRLGQLGLVIPELSVFHAALAPPKSGRRILRHVLQHNQGQVALWCAYAQFELANGNMDVVRRVCSQVLAVERDNPSSALLWSLWAEIEWLCGHNDVCWGVLRAAVGKHGDRHTLDGLAQGHAVVSSIDKLQVLRQLRAAAPSASVAGAAALPTMLAIAQMLSQSIEVSREATGPLLVYQEALSRETGSRRQQIAMALVKFIRLYKSRSRGAFRPRDVHAALVQVVPDAPSPVLYMLAMYELTRIGSVVRNAASPMLFDAQHYAVAICADMSGHRSEHYLRRRIDAATDTMPNAPLLWHIGLAVEREVLQSSHTPSAAYRAKARIYKGIRHCPAEKGTLTTDSSLPRCIRTTVPHCIHQYRVARACYHARRKGLARLSRDGRRFARYHDVDFPICRLYGQAANLGKLGCVVFSTILPPATYGWAEIS